MSIFQRAPKFQHMRFFHANLLRKKLVSAAFQWIERIDAMVEEVQSKTTKMMWR